MKNIRLLPFFFILFSTNLLAESSNRILHLASDVRNFYIYPIMKTVSQSNDKSEGFKFIKINNNLVFYQILAKVYKKEYLSFIVQLNIQISYDSCKSWENIYQFPEDKDLEIWTFNYPMDWMTDNTSAVSNGFGLQITSDKQILFMGKDTSNFIITLQKVNNKWIKLNEQRFADYIEMIQLVGINENESLCLIQDKSINSYRILKSNDNWKSYFIAFQSQYSSDFNNLNLFPELKLLRKNQNVVKEDVICFVHEFKNTLYITDKDFQKFQRIDFINSNEIINLRVLNDSIIYVLTYDSKIYRLYKTIDKGKKWDIIYTDSSKYLKIYNFKIYDENHYVFLGYRFYEKNNHLYKLKYTNDNGNNWQYAFEQNDPLFLSSDGSVNYDTLMTSQYNLYINSQKFIDYPYFPFAYEQIFVNGNLIYRTCPYFEYVDSLNIFFVTLSKGFSIDTNLYPKKIKLNNNYTFREPYGSPLDTSYKISLYKDITMNTFQNYFLLHTNKVEIPPLNLFFTNGNKFLPLGDTLKWNRIKNIDDYDIKIYKFNLFNLSIDKVVIDTTVSDTLLAIPVLQEGYPYVIFARSKNRVDSSRYFPFFVGESIHPLTLIRPNILTEVMLGPNYLEGSNNIDIQDTLLNKNLTISWDKVPNADYYKLFIFKIYEEEFYSKIGEITTTPIVMEENYKNTSYFFDKFEENYIYEIILWAEAVSRRSPIFQAYYVYINSNSIEKNKLCTSLLYPNPTYSTTRVNLQQEGQVAITAVDLLGRSFPLWSGYASTGDMELDVSTLPTGS
ncbi:MAG: hypothetical protein ACPL1A_10115, partial [Candidatus Kapaibacteriota bacterium]